MPTPAVPLLEEQAECQRLKPFGGEAMDHWKGLVTPTTQDPKGKERNDQESRFREDGHTFWGARPE